jgi:hypothetical protein
LNLFEVDFVEFQIAGHPFGGILIFELQAHQSAAFSISNSSAPIRVLSKTVEVYQLAFPIQEDNQAASQIFDF